MSILIFILVLSILIIIHEFGHLIAAKRNKVKVESFSLGFGPKMFGIRKGETEYQLRIFPFGGYVKMAGDIPTEPREGKPWEFLSKSCWERFTIVVSGPLLNYILAFFLFWIIFIIGSPVFTSKIGEVIEGYPAKEAGIKKDDIIIAIDGKPVKYWYQVQKVVRNKIDTNIELTIQREEETLKINIVPKTEKVQTLFGDKEKIALIGIKPSTEMVSLRYNPVESIYQASNKLFTLTYLTFKAIWRIIIGKMSLKSSITGPVGIFYITKKSLQLGFVYLLNVIAVISASLAIFNILPIPVLDGGHIMFIVAEKIKGKPLNPKAQEIMTQIGLYLLIVLMLFVLYSDFSRFQITDKIKMWWK